MALSVIKFSREGYKVRWIIVQMIFNMEIILFCEMSKNGHHHRKLSVSKIVGEENKHLVSDQTIVP